MLRIDLAELLRHTGKHIDVDVDELPASDEDITYLKPARGRIGITNTGSLVLVRGRVKTVLKMECGRCLGEVHEDIEAEIEEQYTLSDMESSKFHDTQASLVADEENELPEGLMDGTIMDLNVVIRQAAILAMPIGPVCKQECRGLCLTCGKNRNEEPDACVCEQKTRNTPLAGLRELFAKELSEADTHSESATDGQRGRNGSRS